MQTERDLTHFLIEDMINARLNGAGPLADGWAGDCDKPATWRLRQVRELLMPAGMHPAFCLFRNRFAARKEAMLDFGRRHELPPPPRQGDGIERA
jgi:hypothetical protein